MTSKIKVDNIENQCGSAVVTKCGGTTTINGTTVVASAAVKTNAYQASDGGNIIDQSGSTITLGASGDTIQLAGGASQTGFGRTGTVDWQTGSIKTATFTAANGEGYFCNTSGGAFTVNLPAGSAGAIVAVADYKRTFQTNNLTLTPNGSEKIGGAAGSVILSTEGQAATFVYVDGTEGWINVQNVEDSESGRSFVTATGGTITECGNFKIHTFTGPGTFCVSSISSVAAENTVGYTVVAGGGGGASEFGGGGAGGFREGRNVPIDNYTASPLVANAPTNAVTITATGFPITVGGGGASNTNGVNSTFSTITSAGGGKGSNASCQSGNGGSGGGGTAEGSGNTGGTGNTPPTTPSQGKNGGNGLQCNGGNRGGGGGGGATAVGGNGGAGTSAPAAGPGGAGASNSITGSSVARAGGGGGAGGGPQFGAPGGTGGGGNGPGGNGTDNTGGGGAASRKT
jgi:hypothetical protein